MMNTGSHLLSPGGGQQSSMVSTPDLQELIQEPALMHSESPSSFHHHDQLSTTGSLQQPAQRKAFKTEYKSKFTPFDQYVYNEVTDSFVKQTPCSNDAAAAHMTNSRSNHDLASHHHQDASLHHQPPAELDVSSTYEPLSSAENHAPASEPWYKEVIRRNEKANEYRYKSEVGHQSPLFNHHAHLRAESPFCMDGGRQLNSLSVNCNESIAGDNLTTTASSDGKSQHSDQAPTELGSQHAAYKFTPHDYKRDHLIAHMANNNNFNLPKESSDSASGKQPQAASGHRTQVSSSGARPTSRSAAQVRSRSQSTRRQPASATSSTMSHSRANNQTPATKSSNTTPVRTISQRNPASAPRAAAATTTNRSLHVTTTAKASTPTTGRTRPATATSTNGLSGSKTTTVTKRTTPVTAASSRLAPKSSNASTTTSRTTPLSSAAGQRKAPTSATSRHNTTLSSTTRTPTTAAPTSITTPRSAAGSRAPGQSVAARKAPATSGLKHTPTGRSPATSGAATNGLSSKTKAPAKSAASQPVSSATTEVKSIKSSGAKAAREAPSAAAMAAGATAAVVGAAGLAAVAANNMDLFATDEQQSKQVEPSAASESQFDQFSPTKPTDPFTGEESNLIFETSDGGNMLADELALAEKTANEAAAKMAAEYEQQEQHNDVDEGLVTTSEDAVEDMQPEEKLQQQDLFSDLKSDEQQDLFSDNRTPAVEDPFGFQDQQNDLVEPIISSSQVATDDMFPTTNDEDSTAIGDLIEPPQGGNLLDDIVAEQVVTETSVAPLEKDSHQEMLDESEDEKTSDDEKTGEVDLRDKVDDLFDTSSNLLGDARIDEPALMEEKSDEPNSKVESTKDTVNDESSQASELDSPSKQRISETGQDSSDDHDDVRLVNGLANGLISAEDKFDSSEREMYSDMNESGATRDLADDLRSDERLVQQEQHKDVDEESVTTNEDAVEDMQPEEKLQQLDPFFTSLAEQQDLIPDLESDEKQDLFSNLESDEKQDLLSDNPTPTVEDPFGFQDQQIDLVEPIISSSQVATDDMFPTTNDEDSNAIGDLIEPPQGGNLLDDIVAEQVVTETSVAPLENDSRQEMLDESEDEKTSEVDSRDKADDLFDTGSNLLGDANVDEPALVEEKSDEPISKIESTKDTVNDESSQTSELDSPSKPQISETGDQDSSDDHDDIRLVNGLANGLISAEDRFDSSEREMYSDMNESGATRDLANDLRSDERLEQQEQDLSSGDEPYSIMPTTTTATTAPPEHQTQPEGSKQDDSFIMDLADEVKPFSDLHLSDTAKEQVGEERTEKKLAEIKEEKFDAIKEEEEELVRGGIGSSSSSSSSRSSLDGEPATTSGQPSQATTAALLMTSDDDDEKQEDKDSGRQVAEEKKQQQQLEQPQPPPVQEILLNVEKLET